MEKNADEVFDALPKSSLKMLARAEQISQEAGQGGRIGLAEVILAYRQTNATESDNQTFDRHGLTKKRLLTFAKSQKSKTTLSYKTLREQFMARRELANILREAEPKYPLEIIVGFLLSVDAAFGQFYRFFKMTVEEIDDLIDDLEHEKLTPEQRKQLMDPTQQMATVFTATIPFGYAVSPDSLHELMPQMTNKKQQSKMEVPSILQELAVNVTKLAKQGKLSPISGREQELERITTILMRKNKSNPVLLGEAGVGKTAIVEGLAQKIAQKQVPEKLWSAQILALNLNNLISGTRFRGDMEERIKELLAVVSKNPNYILFIDELHMLQPDNVNEGANFANVLKPYLARGAVRVIGATTFSEFHKTIERDKALLRRFQTITVDEPDEQEMLTILEKTLPEYTAFHKVEVAEEMRKPVFEIASRYFSSRHNPDKTLDLLDESLALAHKSGDKILREEHLRKVIAAQTNISAQNINNDLGEIAKNLRSEIIGQDEVIEAMTRNLLLANSDLRDENRPLGSFIFMGSTGVGKTELARQLALQMTGSFDNLLRFDMSEFASRESLSRLIGSPAGYVGYNDGGELTEAIKNQPHSVVLFDEIERAHGDIHNLLLQILDNGILTDATGQKVSFRNSIVILTSNLGAKKVYQKDSFGFGQDSSSEVVTRREAVVADAEKALRKVLRPELISRFDEVLVFNSLSSEMREKIIGKLLRELSVRLAKNGLKVTFDKSVTAWIVAKSQKLEMGVRPIKKVIEKDLKNFLAENILGKKIEGKITVAVKKQQLVVK
ncbi:MAG: ATP-dependent Clp protease ATP-binding subunit [Candidatus Nomurabacteria bacterium]|nr:ATP-dependent Clp protease ATP-binding subunit [Candidatus Nomurabacteria bacterium]